MVEQPHSAKAEKGIRIKIKHFPAAACFFMKHAAAVFIVYDSLGTLEPQTCIGLFGTANNIIYKKGNICYTIAI